MRRCARAPQAKATIPSVQPHLVRDDHRLDAVAQAELHQNAGEVSLDRGFSDEQLDGDLGIGPSPPVAGPEALLGSNLSLADLIPIPAR